MRTSQALVLEATKSNNLVQGKNNYQDFFQTCFFLNQNTKEKKFVNKIIIFRICFLIFRMSSYFSFCSIFSKQRFIQIFLENRGWNNLSTYPSSPKQYFALALEALIKWALIRLFNHIIRKNRDYKYTKTSMVFGGLFIVKDRYYAPSIIFLCWSWKLEWEKKLWNKAIQSTSNEEWSEWSSLATVMSRLV